MDDRIIKKIKRIEADQGGYFSEQAMYWWRRYLRNLKVIRNLREENRTLRLLLSDYVENGK